MPRPRCLRKVGLNVEIKGLKPVGLPLYAVEKAILGYDEVEALRLADLEGLYQEQAAESMGVSRPTFSRILSQARRKLAAALIHETAIFVGPSPATVLEGVGMRCPVHGGARRRGRWCSCAGEERGGNDP
jgi:uncharacterized protein